MRKELDITITERGRDQGKTYHLKEMPASRAEKWAMRALMAVARSGIDLPDNFAEGGMQSVAILGIQAITRINFDDAEPLLDEMMECITFKPDPKNPAIVRPLIEDDIEEIRTRIKLREEIIKLHVDFLPAADQSMPTSAVETSQTSSNTPTFQEASVRFSRSGKRQ